MIFDQISEPQCLHLSYEVHLESDKPPAIVCLQCGKTFASVLAANTEIGERSSAVQLASVSASEDENEPIPIDPEWLQAHAIAFGIQKGETQ